MNKRMDVEMAAKRGMKCVKHVSEMNGEIWQWKPV